MLCFVVIVDNKRFCFKEKTNYLHLEAKQLTTAFAFVWSKNMKQVRCIRWLKSIGSLTLHIHFLGETRKRNKLKLFIIWATSECFLLGLSSAKRLTWPTKIFHGNQNNSSYRLISELRLVLSTWLQLKNTNHTFKDTPFTKDTKISNGNERRSLSLKYYYQILI